MSDEWRDMRALNEARILLVDDEAESIKLMRSMLSEFVQVRFATSAIDALRQIRASRPDLVIVDFNMPGMTGLQLCEELQRDPMFESLPVIVATADRPTELECAALQRGAVDFLTKPLNRETFLARVRAHLRSHELASRLKEIVQSGDEPADADVAPARLLVVDDDVSAIRLIQKAVQGLGVVHFATTGDGALRKLHEIRPDVILLDASMPGLDGFSVCAAIKSQAEFAHIPVVFITRFADAEREKRALDLGAADFVSKPFDVSVLRARIRNLLTLKTRIDSEIRAMAAHWRRLADSRVADIVRTASDGVIACDASEHVMLLNDAAARILGCDATAAVGQHIDQTMAGMGDSMEAARRAPVRMQFHAPDGTTRVLEVRASEAESGRLITLIIRDIAEREQLEQARQAQVVAEASAKAKSRLIAWVCHEMGAPLNAILGFSQLLQLGGGVTGETDLKRLQYVRDAAGQLQALLADLMDVSRHEAGTLAIQVQAGDARDAIRSAIETVQPLATQVGAVVHLPSLDAEVPVMADTQRLRQCLVNLLTNGIKYSGEGRRVTLDLALTADETCIAVRDEGIGMSAAQQTALFEPFNRLGRENTTVVGTGLGLVISKSLVEAMGGRILVDSEPGIGTQFTLCLKRPHVAAAT
ncbi:response regulator [Roseateles asaccharophilus]|uniref:histidine kinase n=1 Tax=Roseateles asaccharophilus TaxID=582607 RepID=A0ABU2AAY6_9BURK|nr:response regulator [Roseateles asaccharophilus]MDR7334364.1 PAS domain S-box-containing protein [Roseateles asaccharophilus]